MTPDRLLLPAALGAALALSACAGSIASYPSLAPRPIEQADAAPEAAAPAADALDPAIAARGAALLAQARRGDAGFATAADKGCAAVARGRGAAQGGEGWIAAQQALSAIEAERSPTASALDDINALVLDQARLAETRPKPTDLTPLLDSAREVAALDTAQAARLETVRAGTCKG